MVWAVAGQTAGSLWLSVRPAVMCHRAAALSVSQPGRTGGLVGLTDIVSQWCHHFPSEPGVRWRGWEGGSGGRSAGGKTHTSAKLCDKEQKSWSTARSQSRVSNNAVLLELGSHDFGQKQTHESGRFRSGLHKLKTESYSPNNGGGSTVITVEQHIAGVTLLTQKTFRHNDTHAMAASHWLTSPAGTELQWSDRWSPAQQVKMLSMGMLKLR